MSRVARTTESSRLLTLLSLVAVGAILFLARDILIPFALAVLLSFLLTPAVLWFQRWGLPRIPAIVVVVALSFAVIGFVGWIVAGQVIDLANELPRYRHNIVSKLQALQTPSAGALGRATENIKDLMQDVLRPTGGWPPAVADDPASATAPAVAVEPVPVEVRPSSNNPVALLEESFGPLLRLVASAALVVVFVIFILFQREDLRDRFIRLVGPGRLQVTTQALDDASRRVSRYIVSQLIVNLCFGIPVGIGLYAIGVPNAILWGCLAVLLRFIPYLGAILTASFAIVLSLAVFDGWTRPLITIGMFVTIELILNNLIEPWVIGSRSGITPMALLMSVAFWTWLWGGAGLLLATPLTVCLIVIGRYVPQLEFLSLLSDEPSLPPAARLYQRLLAGDADEAHTVADQFLAERSLEDLYAQVFIPALSMAEFDRHNGEGDESRAAAIRDMMRGLVEELGERPPPDEEQATAGVIRKRAAAPSVICLPARSDADEITALMLVQVLGRHGVEAQTSPTGAEASAVVDRTLSRAIRLACICAMPPFAVTHARHLCKQWRSALGDATIVVGLWGGANVQRSAKRLEAAGCDHVVATFADVVDLITQRRPDAAASEPAASPRPVTAA
jgi:predicted PurR-regulated permease PerM